MVQLKLSTNAKKLKTSWDEYSQKMLQLKFSTNAKNRKPIGTNTHKKCYNSNCQQMRKTVNRLGQILTKNPYNHFLKGQCFNLKGRYKTTCKI